VTEVKKARIATSLLVLHYPFQLCE
jgi:hypothetical protein